MSRCWSYSKAGRRCVEDAGHEGMHADRVTWSDDDAWTPDEQSNVTVVPVVDLPMRADQPKTTTVTAKRCAVCEHPWHDEECERKTQGLPCGCTTALE